MLENGSTVLQFADGAQAGGGIFGTLLMFGAMFAILYFILIRPQQKQQKKHQELLAGLKKGDEVILSSGIIGRVALVEDRIVTIEVGDKTKLRVLKQAVSGLTTIENDTAGNQKTKEQGPTT